MKFIRCLLIGMIVFLLLSPLITTAVSPDHMDTILNQGSLIIATEPFGAPYASFVAGAERNHDTNCSVNCYTENQVTGFDIAVTAAIASELGIDACYINPAHDQVSSGNWSDWDLFTSYFITSDRMPDYYFTMPTVSESSRFFIPANHTNITKPG